MVLGVFSVYDNKSETFSQPMICDAHPDNHKEVAQRLFAGMFKPGSMLYDFPEDYDLYYIGTFNDITGELDQVVDLLDNDPIFKGVDAKELMERNNK